MNSVLRTLLASAVFGLVASLFTLPAFAADSSDVVNSLRAAGLTQFNCTMKGGMAGTEKLGQFTDRVIATSKDEAVKLALLRYSAVAGGNPTYVIVNVPVGYRIYTLDGSQLAVDGSFLKLDSISCLRMTGYL